MPRSWALRLAAIACGGFGSGHAVAAQQPCSGSAVPREPQTPQLAERMLLHPVLVAAHDDRRLRLLPAAAWWFWLDVALAVDTLGDGASLLFEECGCGGRAQFCASYGGDEGHLALLVGRQLLIDLAGAGVALPRDLVPGGGRR